MKNIDKEVEVEVEEAEEETRKLKVLNSLPKEDFYQLSEDALLQAGEGNMISKMFSIFEKRQAAVH